MEIEELVNAGATPATATPLTFSLGETSQRQLSMRLGYLHNSDNDVDAYSFTTTSLGSLTVERMSAHGGTKLAQEGRSFNVFLHLLGPDGTTVLIERNDQPIVRLSARRFHAVPETMGIRPFKPLGRNSRPRNSTFGVGRQFEGPFVVRPGSLPVQRPGGEQTDHQQATEILSTSCHSRPIEG